LLHVESIGETSLFASIKSSLKSIVVKEWKRFVSEPMLIACGILSFKENIVHQFSSTSIEESTEWLLDFGCEYLVFYKLTSLTGKRLIRSRLQDQYSSFAQRNNQFINLVTRIKSSETQHPKSVWGTYLYSAAELAIVALAILSIGSSEAAVERTFSLQKLVHSNRRNRLKTSSVQREMFIRCNHFTISNQSSSHVTNDSENDEDMNCLVLFEDDDEQADEEMHFPDENICEEGNEEVFIAPSISQKSKQQVAEPAVDEFIDYEAVDNFLEEFITLQAIDQQENYRWSFDRMNVLEQASIAANIKFSTLALRHRIKFLVNVRKSRQANEQKES
jgi:hypothetical protein